MLQMVLYSGDSKILKIIWNEYAEWSFLQIS